MIALVFQDFHKEISKSRAGAIHTSRSDKDRCSHKEKAGIQGHFWNVSTASTQHSVSHNNCPQTSYHQAQNPSVAL